MLVGDSYSLSARLTEEGKLRDHPGPCSMREENQLDHTL